MFENIILRRGDEHSPITFGQIAEALLYYQKIKIIFDRGTLFALIQQIGCDRLLTLLDLPGVSAVYFEEILATASDSSEVSPFFRYVVATYAGNKGEGKLQPLQERLEEELKLKGHPEPEAMRFSRAFVKKVPQRSFNGKKFIPGGILELIKSDLTDTEYVNKAMHDIVETLPGGYTAGIDFKFKVDDTANGMLVDSNIKLELINSKRRQLTPPLEPLTYPHLLNYLLDARADFVLASYYDGDFITSLASTNAIQNRCANLLINSGKSKDMRLDFKEMILSDSPDLVGLIDSGRRSFDEYIKFFERTKKFKKWLKNIAPDEHIVKAYIKEVESEPLINSFGGKIIRYIVSTGIGVISPPVGAVAGLVNDFVVDRIFAGWRPNHFISNDLSQFLRRK